MIWQILFKTPKATIAICTNPFKNTSNNRYLQNQTFFKTLKPAVRFEKKYKKIHLIKININSITRTLTEFMNVIYELIDNEFLIFEILELSKKQHFKRKEMKK